MQTTLRTRLGLVSLVVNLGLVAGQIDPTDIANWPECAVREDSTLMDI